MNSHNSSSNEVSEMGNSNLPSPSGGSVGSSTCSALRTVQLKLPNTPTLSGPPSLNEASIAYQKFAVVVASVGDSQAFLLSKTHGIRELTGPVPQGLSSLVGLGGENKNISSGTTTSLSQSLELSESMIINKEIELNKLGLTQMPFDPQDAKSSQIGLAQEETPGYVFNTPEEQKEEKPRNFRDTGGALGPVHSNDDPELHNLMCAVTICDPGDLVIVCSDGLADNFDPVIAHLAVEQSPHLAFVDDDIESEIDLDSDLSDLPEAKSVKGLAEKRVARYVNSLPLSSKTPDGLRFGAKRSQITWTRSSPLPPPPNRSIWPRPPPPPRAPSPAYYSPIIDVSSRIKKSSTQERFSGEVSQSTSIATLSDTAESVDISARSLNFTDRLELTWSERRRYAAKEMERVWHEVDSDSRYPGAVSAHEYAEALLGHVFRVTAARRQLLEAPDHVCLKAATQTLASASRQREVASPAVKVSSGGETISSKSHLRPSSLGLKPTLYSPKELAVRQALLADSLARLPGKLDHATVVVYEVGVFRGDESEVYESGSRSCLSPHSNSSEQRLSNCCNGQFD